MTTAAAPDRGAEAEREPLDGLVDVLCQVETALDRDTIRKVTAGVVRQRARQRRLAAELSAAPDVLRTGAPPAPNAVGRLLLALKSAGAVQLAAPICRVCGREVRRLTFATRTWGCSSCLSAPPAKVPCTRCGRDAEVCSRDLHGRPYCRSCPVTEDMPALLAAAVALVEPSLSAELVIGALERAHGRPSGRREIAAAVIKRPELLTGEGASAPTPGVLRFIDTLREAGAQSVVAPLCPGCGRLRPLKSRLGDGTRRRVAGRTDAGPVCQQCRTRPERACSICGRTGRGTISRVTGQPLCDLCKGHWIVCSRCGDSGIVRGGTLDEPLCARCVNPDPDFWKRCRVCNTTWQLTTAPCTRCSLDARLRELFTSDDGTMAPELDQLRKRLVHVDHPDYAIAWLRKKNVRTTITALVREHPDISHAALDAMPPSKTLDHFRSMLVSVGALEFRDEGLLRIEHEVHEKITSFGPGEHQRALRGFVDWHLLRRLRGRLKDKPASHQQLQNVRAHTKAAEAFLRWLESQGKTLSTCTQTDVEAYAGTKPSYLRQCSAFIRWAVRRRYTAPHLVARAIRWTGPAGPHDEDERWAAARRLLHDDQLPTADRVAGLLVLL